MAIMSRFEREHVGSIPAEGTISSQVQQTASLKKLHRKMNYTL